MGSRCWKSLGWIFRKIVENQWFHKLSRQSPGSAPKANTFPGRKSSNITSAKLPRRLPRNSGFVLPTFWGRVWMRFLLFLVPGAAAAAATPEAQNHWNSNEKQLLCDFYDNLPPRPRLEINKNHVNIDIFISFFAILRPLPRFKISETHI